MKVIGMFCALFGAAFKLLKWSFILVLCIGLLVFWPIGLLGVLVMIILHYNDT